MTKGLARRDVAVSFVLPKKFQGAEYAWMSVYDASVHALRSAPRDVLSEDDCLAYVRQHKCALVSGYRSFIEASDSYCAICFKEVRETGLGHVSLYSRGVLSIAQRCDYQAIHAHDWMTYPAAMLARKVAAARGKRAPFIAHVHATEIDRHDGSCIYKIEKRGMEAADRIVTVSEYTKSVITKHYGIDRAKVSVVHNGIEPREVARHPRHRLKRRYKIVLFVGRITYQKGPDYFVRLAKRVTDRYSNVKFLMIGSGDMQASMVELAAREGLAGKLLFSPWISDGFMDAAYQLADVFVMPSVSEPFGIVPLEAIQNGSPVVVSKNSGFVEVVRHCVAVDFWDIEKMASAIVTLLKNEGYARTIVKKAQDEVKSLTWDLAAGKLVDIYGETVRGCAYA